jgi:hypothetical protein
MWLVMDATQAALVRHHTPRHQDTNMSFCLIKLSVLASTSLYGNRMTSMSAEARPPDASNARANEAYEFLLPDDAIKSLQKPGFLYQNILKIGQLIPFLDLDVQTTDRFNKNFKDIVFRYSISREVVSYFGC